MIDSNAMLIQQELSSGEQLLWSGKPKQGLILRSSDAGMIPFSIFWCGFAIFWEYMAVAHTGKNVPKEVMIFPLFGIPFVLIGLYLVFGRFFVDMNQRTKTTYAVTSERVMILTSGLFVGNNTKSLSLRTMTDISLSEKNNGSGTITFGSTNAAFSLFNTPGRIWPGKMQGPMFEMIDNAKSVYETILKAQKDAQKV